MTRLAQLIAKQEGFGIPRAIPTTHHNPGDLRHSPHSEHAPGEPNGIGEIDTDADGWADLERQLARYAARGLTVGATLAIYAPPSENRTDTYVSNICAGLGLGPEVSMSAALLVPAV